MTARDGSRGTLDIGGPDMDFVAMAEGMGVQAIRATTADEFVAALSGAMQVKGPRLIDAIVPTVF